jgi:aminomethyltransferase
LKETPLHTYHREKSRLTEFAGFEMPLWYTSISEEHLAVRNRVGIFDVSHMGRILVNGPDSDKFLDHLIPTRAALQPPGKSFYTLLLNERGGIEDDLIVLKNAANDYLLVVNAVNTSKDLEHVTKRAKGSKVGVSEITSQSTMIAIQGPDAKKTLEEAVPVNLEELKRFRFLPYTASGHRCLVSRTGYTGEDGFEIIILDSGVEKPHFALKIWNDLAGRATPCGLGARDSLRIEAGYPLYGQELDENTNPFEAELSWVIAMDKPEFVGKSALEKISRQKEGRIRRGVVLSEKVPRPGFDILNGSGERVVGRVTSGTFSPLIRRGIALCYLATDYSQPKTPVEVKVRESTAAAEVTHPPFYDESRYGWKREHVNGK